MFQVTFFIKTYIFRHHLKFLFAQVFISLKFLLVGLGSKFALMIVLPY